MPAIVPIQTRNGTAAEWTAANPILLKGEQGIETDTNKVKYGDGVTAWISLAYAGGGGSYTLPTASPTVLGGVKIDNNTILIDGTGVISANAALHVKLLVRNATGSTIAKGKAVYVNGANGTNVTIALAQANAESTSSQTLGLVEADILTGADGYVLTQGALAGLDTTAAANEGDPVYLSPTVAGGLVYGIANKPSAPSHLVYMGTVSRKNLNNGEIFIKVQNGYELEELHNVKITTPVNNNVLRYDSVTSLWINDVLPLPTASTTVLGGVKVDGTSITINGSGVISGASTYTLPTASTTVLGGVKIDGTTITINGSGVISGTPAYTLPTASTTVLGGVKVDGTSITINGSGVISGASTYTLPTASTTVLGGVKIDGTTITINGSGVISSSGGSAGVVAVDGGNATSTFVANVDGGNAAGN